MQKCTVCNELKDSITIKNGKIICTDCLPALRKKEILEKAGQSEDSRFFKDWSSKDRTTAFFETFGRYVKEPNKRDFLTIYHIWLWAVHDDKALVETISYTFKWAKMSIHEEYAKWRENEK